MSISAFDHPFLSGLLGDEEVSAYFSEDADIRAMLAFETALAKAEARHGVVPQEAARRIAEVCAAFQPDIASLKTATAMDGVVVPDLVKQLRKAVGGEAAQHVHFGATSQDVIDTALALRLRNILTLFGARLERLGRTFAALEDRFGTNRLMGRTRMQAAIPIAAGDRLAVWNGLVDRALARLDGVRQANLILSLAGPAGTSDKFGAEIGNVRETLAGLLQLSVPDYVPHAARDRIVLLGNWLSEVTGALGKIGQDVALMAQNEIGEIQLSGAGGSSAMAHKQNPVLAEVLVTLARYNAVQVSGLHQALIHEQERSGAAWTLEWLILPQMLNAAGTALVHAQAMLDAVERIGEPAD